MELTELSHVRLKMNNLSIEELDEEFKKRNLIPPSEMMNGNPFQIHAGVCDLETFEQYLRLKNNEFLKMRSALNLEGRGLESLEGDEKDELFEWVVAGYAAYSDILANFLSMKKYQESLKK